MPSAESFLSSDAVPMGCHSLDAIPASYAHAKLSVQTWGEMMSGNVRRGMTARRWKFRRIAVFSVSVATPFGLAGTGAGAAEATVPAHASRTASSVLQPTN